jgi:O-antigen/teichoic acid export membrane protein
MEYLAYGDVLNKTLLSACGIALVLLGFGATALVALMFAAAAMVLVLNFLWSRRYFAIDWELDPVRLRSLLLDSLPYWSYVMVANFYLWIGSAILAVMAPTTVVGWYGGSTKLLQTLMFAPVILSTAWLPKLVAAFEVSPARLKLIARLPTEQIMVLSLPVCVGAALIAGPLIRFLYGPEFARAVPVFVILALTVPPTYFNWLSYQILIACKRQMAWTKALAAATIVNLVLNLLLIRYSQQRLGNGAVGAAVSFLLTELLMAAIGFALVHPFVHRETLSRLGRSALAALGLAACLRLAGPVGLGAQLGAGVTCFLVLAIVFRVVTPEEVRTIQGRMGEWVRSWKQRLWTW